MACTSKNKKQQAITTTVVDVKDTIGQHKETDLLVNIIYREREKEEKDRDREREGVVVEKELGEGGGGGQEKQLTTALTSCSFVCVAAAQSVDACSTRSRSKTRM